LFKERLLVSKRLIKACWLDPHRGGQVIQRSPFKSLLPEDMHGAIKRLFLIETTRPSRALWRSAYHDSFNLPHSLVIAK
jgi:hypothetical protein